MTSEFYAESNDGGDYIKVKEVGEDKAYLEVGHQCVIVVEAIVPVEFITAAIVRALDSSGGVEGVIKGVGWPEKYTNDLLQKVSYKTRG